MWHKLNELQVPDSVIIMRDQGDLVIRVKVGVQQCITRKGYLTM